jgi:hypothetical protein
MVKKITYHNTYVYAYNQNEAISNFRNWMKETGSSENKYIPLKARYAGTKHNMKVYQISYKIKKKK